MVLFRSRRNALSIMVLFVAGTALSVRYGCFSWQEQHFEHVMIFFRGGSSALSTLCCFFRGRHSTLSTLWYKIGLSLWRGAQS